MSRTAKLAMVAALTFCAPWPASAQRSGEIVLYSQVGFRGQSVVINSEQRDVRLGWVARSVRVAPGDAWELCQRTRFRSPCNRVAENIANVGWPVRSARRSLAATLPEPAPPTGGGGPSLRGMSAEFFPRPSDRRGRLPSCTSGAARCAAEAADRFCRSGGWAAASYHRQETIGGRNLLADVLCTRTGG